MKHVLLSVVLTFVCTVLTAAPASDFVIRLLAGVTLENATIDNINDKSTDNVSEDAKKTAISEAVTANPAFLDIRVIIQNHSLYNIISLLIY